MMAPLTFPNKGFVPITPLAGNGVAVVMVIICNFRNPRFCGHERVGVGGFTPYQQLGSFSR